MSIGPMQLVFVGFDGDGLGIQFTIEASSFHLDVAFL